MDREAWHAAIHGVAESDTTERLICGVASSKRHHQLTFPAPTGPTTANSSPGLTVKESP